MKEDKLLEEGLASKEVQQPQNGVQTLVNSFKDMATKFADWYRNRKNKNKESSSELSNNSSDTEITEQEKSPEKTFEEYYGQLGDEQKNIVNSIYRGDIELSKAESMFTLAGIVDKAKELGESIDLQFADKILSIEPGADGVKYFLDGDKELNSLKEVGNAFEKEFSAAKGGIDKEIERFSQKSEMEADKSDEMFKQLGRFLNITDNKDAATSLAQLKQTASLTDQSLDSAQKGVGDAVGNFFDQLLNNMNQGEQGR